MDHKVPALTYKHMCDFLRCNSSELTTFVFTLFETKGNNTVDIRKILIALSSILFTSYPDLLNFQFEVLDQEHTGYLSDEELVVALQANNFASSPVQVYPKAKIILSYSQNVSQRKAFV